MAVPTPPKALDGHCSTINDGTLYVLSSSSFQSIALKENATWSQEALGKAVTGAACSKVGTGSNAALYVVGGTSSDSSYSGLQRYLFGSKTWETLTPLVDVMKNRLNHTVSYIPDTNKLLVYAGLPSSQSDWLSSQTFTIVAQSPWVIDSYSGRGHTANLPILDQWNSSHGFMTGGTDLDASTFLFDPVQGWIRWSTNLPAALSPGVKGRLIQGTDGSKVLQTYDLSVSPNKVQSIVLQNADGSPAGNGQLLGGSAKRALSINAWPAYNSTIAPTITRSDYSVATDGNGLVAFAGGNSNNPITLFDQNSNGWVDTSKYFYGDQVPLQTSTTSSISSSATATSMSSTSAAAATSTSDTTSATSSATGVSTAIVNDAASRQHQMLVLELGVIIGVCGGLFLLFLLVLLYLRWRRKRANAQETEPGRMSFADRGASFMKEAEGSQHNFFPTADRYNNSSRLPPVAPGALRKSRFSLSRFSGSGRGSSGYNNSGRGSGIVQHQHKSSWESMKELVEEKNPDYKSPQIEMLPVGVKKSTGVVRKPAPTFSTDRGEINNVLGIEDERDRRKRSSGWSRYFNATQPTGDNGLSHLPSAYSNKPLPTPAAGQYTREQAYNVNYAQPTPPIYTQAPVPPIPAAQKDRSASPTHIPPSTLMQPLNIDFTKTLDGQRLSHVASSSPSYQDSKALAKRGSLAEPQHGQIEESERPRPISTATASSYSENRRRTRSSIAASEFFANQHGINGTWTPITTSFKDHVNDASGQNSRRTSSMYTTSIYGEPQSKRKSGGSGFFSAGNKSAKSRATHATSPSADWEHVKDELKMPSEFRDSSAAARESNITVFPEPAGDSYTAVGRGPSQKSQKNGSGLAGITHAAAAKDDRASNMTLFPRAVSVKHYPGAARETEIKASSSNNDVGWIHPEDIGAAK